MQHGRLPLMGEVSIEMDESIVQIRTRSVLSDENDSENERSHEKEQLSTFSTSLALEVVESVGHGAQCGVWRIVKYHISRTYNLHIL